MLKRMMKILRTMLKILAMKNFTDGSAAAFGLIELNHLIGELPIPQNKIERWLTSRVIERKDNRACRLVREFASS